MGPVLTALVKQLVGAIVPQLHLVSDCVRAKARLRLAVARERDVATSLKGSECLNPVGWEGGRRRHGRRGRLRRRRFGNDICQVHSPVVVRVGVIAEMELHVRADSEPIVATSSVVAEEVVLWVVGHDVSCHRIDSVRDADVGSVDLVHVTVAERTPPRIVLAVGSAIVGYAIDVAEDDARVRPVAHAPIVVSRLDAWSRQPKVKLSRDISAGDPCV